MDQGLTVVVIAHLPATPGKGMYADCKDLSECAEANNRLIAGGVSGPNDLLAMAQPLQVFVQPPLFDPPIVTDPNQLQFSV